MIVFQDLIALLGLFSLQITIAEKRHGVREVSFINTIQNRRASYNYTHDDDFELFLADGLDEELNLITKSKEELELRYSFMADRLRDYDCQKSTTTTNPMYSYMYTSQYNPEKQINIDVLLDMPHSKIWKVDNFTSEDECMLLIDHARPRLERAAVVSADGSAVESEDRKAQQAQYDSDLKDSDDPIRPLRERILDITNHHGEYNLNSEGQEDINIIQYTPGGEYIPHCDGDCEGGYHLPAGRVATAIVYCHVPEQGGGTTFSRSGIYIQPMDYSAVFFSYKGPDGRMDEGYTEHSGCPVIEGEKWIATFWMREGVSAVNPADWYDPNGKRLASCTGENDNGDGEVNESDC
jgi:hypothetical protein